MKTLSSCLGLSLLFPAVAGFAAERDVQKNPNIIFFLVDDYGWSETSLPFGSDTCANNRKFHTPNMERLAKRGTMFTNAYACSVSTPTRTSLMTGMNAANMHITNFCSLFKDRPSDAIGGAPGTTNPNESDIFANAEWNHNAFTPVQFQGDSAIYGINHTQFATPMVELLRDAGYYTIHVGKAHWSPAGMPGSNPLNMGFMVQVAGSGNGHPKSYQPEDYFGKLRQKKVCHDSQSRPYSTSDSVGRRRAFFISFSVNCSPREFIVIYNSSPCEVASVLKCQKCTLVSRKSK